MDVAETVKNMIAKGMQQSESPFTAPGYITEKLYMLLQIYLQNKSWNPSLELLQCFTELKETAMLPSAAYLHVLASRISLDSQGRLILRENGKIILPFEHFANAVMLKHMNGPHGLHLSLEATVRAVIESYTIGRENYGMEKDFIIEVVQNCPSSACRFFKAQLDLSQSHSKSTYLPDMQPPLPASLSLSLVTPGNSNLNNDVITSSKHMAPPPQPPLSVTSTPPSRPSSNSSRPPSRPPSVDLTPTFESLSAVACNNNSNNSSNSSISSISSNNSKLAKSQTPPVIDPSPPPPPVCTPIPPPSPKPPPTPKPLTARQQQQNKLADFLKANLENFDSLSSSKESYDGINGEDGKRQDAGQEKIIRTFSEIMKNMGKMKSCVRPAMCKPYGKQSEALQKTVIDTIQLVQSLRSLLPPPHIAVSSWKNEDKHSRLERKLNANSIISPTMSSSSAVSFPVTSTCASLPVDTTANNNANAATTTMTSSSAEDLSDLSPHSAKAN